MVYLLSHVTTTSLTDCANVATLGALKFVVLLVFAFFWSDNLFSWYAKKQPSMARSSSKIIMQLLIALRPFEFVIYFVSLG